MNGNRNCFVGIFSLYRLTVFLVFGWLILSIPSCGGDGDSPVGAGGGNTIGASGGTVNAAGGASVVIPAGALSVDTDITAATLPDKEDLPDGTSPLIPLLGAAQFGPAGTQFALPVTITIPLDPPVGTGGEVSVMYWNETTDSWEVLVGDSADVNLNTDGSGVTFKSTHFSLFSAVANVFDNFDANFGDGSTAESAFSSYAAWFKSNVTNIGRKGIYEDDCHEVVGLRIGLSYDVNYLPDGPHYQGIPYQMEGRSTDKQVTFYMGDDRSKAGVVDFNYALEVYVFLECCAPSVDVSADPGTINIEETSQVTATVMCDNEAMAGHQVTFEPQGGLGTVSPGSAAVSGGGTAVTTFTADDEEGTESVRASLTTCKGSETPDGAAQIEINSDWTASMAITFTHDIGSEPLFQFVDIMNLNLNLDIASGVVTGTGTGSHNVSLSTAGNCGEQSMVAPGFLVGISGAVVGGNLEFIVVPTGVLTVSFVLNCVWDEQNHELPYPGYGWLESSVMGQALTVTIPWENGGTDSGSGVEPSGGDPPFEFSYTITLSGQ